MGSVFVQADDFSGAAEVGYCFVEHHLSAQVLLGTGTSRMHDGADTVEGPSTDVIVTDTHSRGLSEAAAEGLVKGAFSGPSASGARVMFKKMDSLWRGNMPAEIRALASLGFHAVVAGALPQLERSVVDGRPLVAGIPLAETDLWQAEVASPPTDVPSLLRPEDPASIQTVNLDGVRSSSLTTKLAGLLNSDLPRLVVVDGETMPDLEHVVDALLDLMFRAGGRRIVLVGTGGAADVLAQRLKTQAVRNTQKVVDTDAATVEPEAPGRPVLAVVGSASKTAQAQLAQLEAQGFTVVRLHPLYAGAMHAYVPQLAQVSSELKAGNPVAVALAAVKVDPAKAANIVGALSKFAAEAAKAVPADLILTGGETAREVLDAVGCSNLVPIAAVQHGAVLSRANDGTLVGTKPGNFGDDLALLQLYDEIRKRRARPPQGTPANAIPQNFPRTWSNND
ncbi:four-carbon acid sugar kinase family protein [Arthrobacter sp. NPDC056493]|uniref:four-carbon acid sugar kinase family protein n=1 Tax=Arthrobacter sp. NPDC056493 TaxID=3345839 RepID=UPI00366F3C95